MKSQISPFERISCCSHFFLSLGTQFVKALCRSTYSAVHVPQSSSDRKTQNFNSLSYIFFGVFTLLLDCSIKFCPKALQGCNNAVTLCVCVRERDVTALTEADLWLHVEKSQLCEVSTPGKLISCTREPSHVVWKCSTTPWSLSFFDAGEYPTWLFSSGLIFTNSSVHHCNHILYSTYIYSTSNINKIYGSTSLYFKELNFFNLEVNTYLHFWWSIEFWIIRLYGQNKTSDC